MLTSVGAENVQGIYAADDTMVAGAIDALKARDIDPEPLHITSIGNTELGNPLVIVRRARRHRLPVLVVGRPNAIVVAIQVLNGEERRGGPLHALGEGHGGERRGPRGRPRVVTSRRGARTRSASPRTGRCHPYHPGAHTPALLDRPARRLARHTLDGRISRRHGHMSGGLRGPGRRRTGCASYRLSRAMDALGGSGCGAFLLFDFYNIRYTTQTWIGGALGRQDVALRPARPGRQARTCGTSARRPSTTGCSRRGWRRTAASAGMLGLRGAISPDVGLMRQAVVTIKGLLTDAGVVDQPVGVDIVEPAFLFEMQAPGAARRRHPAGHARRPRDQVGRRDHAAQPGGGHGRRRLPGHRRRAAARDPRERDRRPGQQAAATRWARSRSRRSTPSPASGATPTRTTSPTASSGRATRRSSTSSTPTTATGPATTGRSPSARARRPSTTPTPGPGSGWTPRSTRWPTAWAPTRSPRSGPRRPTSASSTRWTPSACSSATASASACTSARSSPGSTA